MLKGRTGRILVILLPALPCLAWVLAWACTVPEPASWLEDRGLPAWSYSGQDLQADDVPGWQWPLRALHLELLRLPGVTVHRTALLGWLLALLTVLAVAALARRTTPHRRWRRAVALAAVGLAAFAPAYGADWLIAARFRVFVPALLTAVAVALLAGRKAFPLRFLAAAVLAGVAPFAGRAGVLVWIAGAPFVTRAARHAGSSHSLRWLVPWLLLGNAGTLLAHHDDGFRVGLLGHLLEDPGGLLRFVAGAAGQSVPAVFPGFGGEDLLVGAVLGIALVGVGLAVARRRDAHGAAAWTALALFGALRVVVLADEGFGAGGSAAVQREMAWGSWLLPVGLAGAVACRWPRLARATGAGVVGAALLLLVQDAHRGWEHLKLQNDRLRRIEAKHALLPVADVLPAGERAAWQDAEDFLRGHEHGRYRPLVLLHDRDLGGERLHRGGAWLGRITAAREARIEGVVHATTLRPAVPMVLVTRRRDGTETVVAAAPPRFAGNKTTPWSATLPVDRLERGDRLRALGMDPRTGALAPLAREVVFDGTALKVSASGADG